MNNNDGSWLPVVHEVIRRARYSLLQYLSEAYPWARSDEQQMFAQLQKLIDEERQAVVALTQFLRRRHLPAPYLGANFPMSYTSMHFVSLDFMLPQLVEHTRQALALLERDVVLIHDAEARSQVERALEMKRRHLKQIEALAKQAAAA